MSPRIALRRSLEHRGSPGTRRRPVRVALALLLSIGLLSACSATSEPSAERSDPAASPAPGPRGAGPVTVRVIDEERFVKVLERYRGKPVLIDFWATWCTGCVARFPHTVALHRRFSDRGLVTISVSFDEPEDEAGVLKFLRAQGADFDNFISQYGGSTQSVETFRLQDGTLPCLKLIDREGKLYREFSGEGFTEEDIDRAVRDLVQRPPDA